MAYIQPDGYVQFFGDIGLSPNYENTLYFSSEAAKNSYFDGVTKVAQVTKVSYTRENRGFIRVELPMSTMYHVGYMRFKNTSFENKWFYAFVKRVNYINNLTTEVEFELDVIMTWMGVFSLRQCFVERQHTITDNIGEHIISENLPTGDYVCEGKSTTAFFGDYRIALYKTVNTAQGESVPTNVIQGTYVPLLVTFYDVTTAGVTALQSYVDNLVANGRSGEIVALRLVPYRWSAWADQLTPAVGSDNFTVNKPYSGSTQWGSGQNAFVPNNKKLYTYPYKYLMVEDCEGGEVNYKYELFNSVPPSTSSGVCTFRIRGSAATPETNIMCYPYYYNGIADDDYTTGVKMMDFPTVAFNDDFYKAYLAQRDSTALASIITGMIAGAVTGGMMGGAPGAAVGAAGGLLKGVAAPLIEDVTDKITGDNSKKNQAHTRGSSSPNLMAQMRAKNFYFHQMCITREYAEMIDNYFDMYGYAIKKCATPNMNARPYWTYVKTVGCTLDGNLPADDAAQIERIFDSGIRFWKNHLNIGNYSGLNNSPA